MDHFDPMMEQRVWERVSGARPDNSPAQVLRPMMAAAAENAAVYRQLAQGAGGREREQLQRLSDGEHALMKTLRGMAILGGAEDMTVSAYGGGKQSRRRALSGCYRRGMENYRQFASRTAEPEYGAIFQELAESQSHRLGQTLELLGEKQR